MALSKRDRPLPSVTNYVKNVGKSLAFATIEYGVKPNADGIADFLDTNEDVFKEIYSSVKNYRETARRVGKSIRESKEFVAADALIKNFLEDARTGNFWNEQRVSDMSESILGLDEDFGFDDDDDYDYSSSESSVSRDTEVLADSFDKAIGAASKSQALAAAKGTEVVVKTTQASTRLVLGGLDRLGAHITSGFGSLYASTDQVNKFLQGPMLAHLENSKTYYENSYKLMQEQNAMMKELLEMQRNIYTKRKDIERYEKISGSMNYNGNVNLKGYFKNIKSNASDILQDFGLGMMDMGGGNPYLMFAAAPFRLLMEPLVERLVSKDFKKALQGFDKAMTSFFSNMVVRMNKMARDDMTSGPMKLLARLLGLDVDEKKNIDTSKYEKGAVPFDGITRKTIVEVIPSYLARIEAAILGKNPGDERHFDHETGTWKSAKKLSEEARISRQTEINRAFYDVNQSIDEIYKQMAADKEKALRDQKKAEEEIKKMKQDLAREMKNVKRTMGNAIWDDGGVFDPVLGGKMYGFDSDEDLKEFMKYAMADVKHRGRINDIARNTLQGKQNQTNTMRRIEAQGGAHMNIYSGAYDSEMKGINRFSDPGNMPASYAKLSYLNLSKDDYGNNVFYYLREILRRLGGKPRGGNYGPRNKGPRGGGGGSAPTSGGTSGTESSESGEEPPSDWDLAQDAVAQEVEEDEKKKAKQRKFKESIKETMGQSRIGKWLYETLSGVKDVVSHPLEYAARLLDKADKSMFALMFGDRDWKTKDGVPIDSVFDYIIYNIKESFKKLNAELKKIFEPFKKYTDPVVNTLKQWGKNAKDKVSGAFRNTFGRFGRVFNADDVAAGGATDPGSVPFGDAAEATTSAGGRIVTKRGLTMISPGEIIIPRSFDKREQGKDLAAEKREKNRIMQAIDFNAKGNVTADNVKATLEKILQDAKGANYGKAGAGGIIGGAAGLLTGGNPLLMALAGAGISILSESETVKRIFFGEEITDKNGNKTGQRAGGIIPKKIQDFFKKAGGDMSDLGIVGGVLGLLTPFGPLGGAAIGAGIGMLKHSEKFKKFVFGDSETGEDGIISKETYDKIKAKIKKGTPNIVAGAAIGALTGPFGLIGNLVLGSGLGMLTTTSAFNKFVFGDPKDGRKGSLVGAIQRGIMDPAKEKISEIVANLKKFTDKYVLDPMKRFWDPFKQGIKNLLKDVTYGIKDGINKMMERTIGIPIHDFLQQKIFKPLTKTFFNVLKLPINLAKGAVAAPMALLGGIGNSMRMRQIAKGKATDMTARERLDFRNAHKNRAWMNRILGKDTHLQMDEQLANMDSEQINQMISNLGAQMESSESIQKEIAGYRKTLGEDVSAFMNKKDANGKLRYDSAKYGKVKKMVKSALDSGNIEQAKEYVNKMGLSLDDKAELIKIIERHERNIVNAKSKLDLKATYDSGELDKMIEQTMGPGFKFKNAQEKRYFMENLKREQAARNAQEDAFEGPSAEEKEHNAIIETSSATEAIKQEVMTVGGILNNIQAYIHKLVYPDEPLPDSIDTSNLPATIKNDIATPATAVSDGVDGAIKGPGDKIYDQKTGLFINGNEDSKENTENAQKRDEMEKAEHEETEETKKTNTLLGGLMNKLFGKDKNDKKEKKGGFLGKLANFFGMGDGEGGVSLGKVLLGASVFGLLAQAFKNHMWPTIKESLMGRNQDSFIGRLLGGIGEKFNKVKEWFESEGGLSGILTNRVIPKFVEGLQWTASNIVAPLTAALVKSLPSLLASTVKGILEGLKMAIFNKDLPGSTNRGSTTMDVTDSLKEIENIRASNSRGTFGIGGGFGGTATAINTTTGATATVNYDFSKPKASANTATGNPGSGVMYDEEGNVISSYKQLDGSNNMLSQLTKGAGQSFKLGLAGQNAGVFSKGVKSIFSKGFGKKGTRLVSSAIGTASKTATGIMSKLNKAGQNVRSKVGSKLKGFADDTIGLLEKGYSNFAAQKVVGTVTSNTTKGVGEKITKGLTTFFANFAESKAGTTIMNLVKKFNGTVLTKEALEAALKKIAEKTSKNCLTRAAGTALSKVVSAVASMSPLAVLFAVGDFTSGMRNAETILGVAKGDEDYTVSIPMRVVCGLMHMLNNRFLLGIIPTEILMDIIIEYIAPIFGIDNETLNTARENAVNVLDEWNEAHVDDPYAQYDNLEDFNKKDRLWSKFKTGVKKTWDSITGNREETNIEKPDQPTSGNGRRVGRARSNVGVDTKHQLMLAMRAKKNEDKKIESLISGSMNIFDTDYWVNENQSRNGIFGTSANAVSNVEKTMTSPLGMLNSGIASVSKTYKELIDKIERVVSTKKQDDDKIERALKGELSIFNKDYWKNADHDGNGFFGVMANITSYIEKIFNAPAALIAGIGAKLEETFNKIKDWISDKFGFIGDWVDGISDNVPDDNGNVGKGRRVGMGRRSGRAHAYQDDPSISGMKYGDSTIGDAGCGPVAATNLINSLGGNMSVGRAARYAENTGMTVSGGGTDMNYFNSILGSQGIESKTTSNRHSVENALKSGNQVVMLGRDRSDNGTPFGTIPHFITATGMDKRGNIIAEDPDLPDSKVTYNKNKVLNSMVSSVIAGKARNRRLTRDRIFGRSRKLYGKAKTPKGFAIDADGQLYQDPNANGNMPDNRLLGPEAVLNVARSQLGMGIDDGGNNTVKYNAWYWNYHGQPWCCAFVNWVFRMAGAGMLFYGGGKTAYCPTLLDYYRSAGQVVSSPMPGDIVFFCFGGERADHGDGGITTIEGNTSAGDATNGQGVERHTYVPNSNCIMAYARPAYPYEYKDPSEFGDDYDDGDNYDYESVARTGVFTGNPEDYAPNSDPNAYSPNTDTGAPNNYNNPNTYTNPSSYTSPSTYTNPGNSNTGGLLGNYGNNTSSGGNLISAITDLGKNIMKAMWGDGYTALFGDDTSSSSSSPDANSNPNTNNSSAPVVGAPTGPSYGSPSDNSTGEGVEGTTTLPTDPASVTGGSDAEKIWNYLISKGYTKAGVAGIMGNLQAESGLSPINLQNSYETSLGHTDESYTRAIDDGSYSMESFRDDSAGYGLAQWTYGDLKKRMHDTIKGRYSNSIGDLISQLDFLNETLHYGTDTGYHLTGLKDTLTSTDDVDAATDAFLDIYEKPKVRNYGPRRAFAQQFYQQFANRPEEQSTGEEAVDAAGTTPPIVEPEDAEISEDVLNASADDIKDQGQSQEAEAPVEQVPAAEENAETGPGPEQGQAGKGRHKNNTGIATEALRRNTRYIGKARTAQPVAGYEQLLQTIIGSLATIANNTALLTKILEVLSSEAGGTGEFTDKGDIDSAVGGSRAKGQAALDRLIEQSRGNSRGISTLLGNKDTEYIIEAMTALARE